MVDVINYAQFYDLNLFSNTKYIYFLKAKIISDSISSTGFLTNFKLQTELNDIITKTASLNNSVYIFFLY
jgi:hypothetical protein